MNLPYVLLCESEEVGDVEEDMSIAAAGRSDEDETAMMASYWETPSGDELSEFTTPSSLHHMVVRGGGGGDGFSLTERTAHASASVAFEEEEEGGEEKRRRQLDKRYTAAPVEPRHHQSRQQDG
ncbi:hypothetical protein ECG_08356 [Echinococcus granulosus]|nr:hypothetical protein ECG_08356 [Echinococcus granulosus]